MEYSTGAEEKFPAIRFNTTLKIILWSISVSYSPFKEALKKDMKNEKKEIADYNERALVQIFVGQNDIQLRLRTSAIRVDKEYTDIVHDKQGVVDIAYIPLEEGVEREPLFVVEAKRLPAPDHTAQREKEYVVGHKQNGGIERFKARKHGTGLSACGIIGFIGDNQSVDAWIEQINSWIVTKSLEAPDMWSSSEVLTKDEKSDYIVSFATRSPGDVIDLYHFFVPLL
jgi:hypothetical protein